MPFDPKTSMLRRSAIAACALWDTDRQHIFFQDHNGGIRQISYKGVYLGGDRHSRLTVANNAKWHTPLAVAGYDRACGKRDCSGNNHSVRIHLFYLNAENFIRGVSFDGEAWVTNTNFNKQLIRVHPSSKLAVVAMYPSNHLRLFYQTEDHNIHEHVYTPEAGWLHQAVIISAITGSSIAVAAYPCRDELSLFYQDVDCFIRQLTKTNEDTYVEGSLVTPDLSPQCAFSAVCTEGLMYATDVIRLHVVIPLPRDHQNEARNTISEFIWYKSQSTAFNDHVEIVTNSLNDGYVATVIFPLNEREEVRFYYQSDSNQMLQHGIVNGEWSGNCVVQTGETSVYET